jgi:hypothetical protein
MTDLPAWLAQWREVNGVKAPLVTTPPKPPKAPKAAPEPPPPKPGTPVKVKLTAPQGSVFIEPNMWDFDGFKRREPVLDPDYFPPRVVRFIGWNPCMRCAREFFSHDVKAVRLCSSCKAAA